TSFAAPPDCTGQSFSCFVGKYHFNNSQGNTSVPPDVLQRLLAFAPHAAKGAAAYNTRFKNTTDPVEPELIMWWTYSEGITAHENWSNCSNESSNYALNLNNCDNPSFWQLGPAGTQFGFMGYFDGKG